MFKESIKFYAFHCHILNKEYRYLKKLIYQIIVNKLRNGYRTVGNVKVVSIDSFKQLQVANKVDCITNYVACIL